MPVYPEKIWLQPQIVQHTQRLLHSYRHFVGDELIPRVGGAAEQSHAVFFSPEIVVSHGTEADPIFNYANIAAMKVWELDWIEFTRTPSRLSAEPLERSERDRLLAEVSKNGCIHNYRCVRISKSGRRFEIENVTVWNLLDEQNERCGQAAMYSKWRYLTAEDRG